MAIAAYDSDLTSANGGELTTATTVGNWDESSDGAWDDAGTMVAETNFYIQGAECISAQFTKTGVGTIINIQGASFTVDTDGAILIWSFWSSPSSLATYANGGVRTLVGNSLGDFYVYKASGSDFAPNPIGGWANYAIDPASATIDTTVGTPTGTWTHVGTAVNATAQARGNPHAVDAIRVGRCTLEVTDGQAGDYGTFTGMSNFDTSTNQRYALFQKIFGGYKWQGLMSLGLTGTAVDFRDSNANIFVANTPQVSTNFNKIEIHNIGSNVEWTSISISAQDGVDDLVAATASRGIFTVIDNATINLTTCTFTDMDTFTFQSNSASIGTVFRRCNLITQDGSTITDCTFDASNSTPALLVNNLNLVTGTSFTSAGTGHAIELSATGTYNWSGNTFSGYGATGTTDAVIYNNSNGAVTINVSSGALPTYLNGAGASTTVQASFTLTVKGLELNTEVRIYRASDGTALGGVESATISDGDGKYKYDHAYSSAEAVYIKIMHLDYIYQKINYTLSGSNESLLVQQTIERNYNNP